MKKCLYNSIFLSVVLFSGNAFGSDKTLFCGIRSGMKYKKEVERFRNDKTKHCALSCMIAVHCPDSSAYIVGYLKEMWDLVSPGDADPEDIVANSEGIKISSDISLDNAVSGCIESCLEIYPSR
jgi:hypothetical protein